MSFLQKQYKIDKRRNSSWLVRTNNIPKQFKLDAVQYVNDHPDLTQLECAKNLGISVTTLYRWLSQYRDNDGDIPVRGSGNYQSDEQKDIAQLKRELRDVRMLSMCKKSHRHSGKRLTVAIYTEVAAKAEISKVTGRRISVSGMLKNLGVSRSGYQLDFHAYSSPVNHYNHFDEHYGNPIVTPYPASQVLPHP